MGSAKWAVAKKPRGLGHRRFGPGGLEPQVVGPEGAEEGCECQVNKALGGRRRPDKALQSLAKFAQKALHKRL